MGPCFAGTTCWKIPYAIALPVGGRWRAELICRVHSSDGGPGRTRTGDQTITSAAPWREGNTGSRVSRPPGPSLTPLGHRQKQTTAAVTGRGRKSIQAQWTCSRHRFWIDTAPGFTPELQQGRYTRRLRPSGMVNVSIRSAPRHWRTGRQGRPRSFPFADEEVFSCAISAMRKPWRIPCAMP